MRERQLSIDALTWRVLLAVSTLLAMSVARSEAPPEGKLWARLKSEPNLVVLMRHTAAQGNPLTWDPTGACKGEAVISAEGREQAQRIKAAFAARGINPTVISSPMCRCMQTAELAFAGKPITDPILRETDSADNARKKAFEAKAHALFRQKRGKPPIVFISHRPNIFQLTQGPIDYQELVVAKADTKGVLTVLGTIKVGKTG